MLTNCSGNGELSAEQIVSAPISTTLMLIGNHSAGTGQSAGVYVDGDIATCMGVDFHIRTMHLWSPQKHNALKLRRDDASKTDGFCWFDGTYFRSINAAFMLWR